MAPGIDDQRPGPGNGNHVLIETSRPLQAKRPVKGEGLPPERVDVVEQYCIEHELSRAKREQLLRIAVGSVPWFVALSLTISYVASLS